MITFFQLSDKLVNKNYLNKWKSHSEEWLFPGLKIIANFFSERINCKQFIR